MATVRIEAGLQRALSAEEEVLDSTAALLSYIQNPPKRTPETQEPARKKRKGNEGNTLAAGLLLDTDTVVLARVEVVLVGYSWPGPDGRQLQDWT
jgi:hypothetical protein